MKKKIIVPIIIILVIMFIPIPSGVYKDGGTRTYSALTYKIVKWNKIVTAEGEKYQKTLIYWFPNNLRSLDKLWEKEAEL